MCQGSWRLLRVGVIDLGGSFCSSGATGAIKPRGREGAVATVEGVGFTRATTAHINVKITYVYHPNTSLACRASGEIKSGAHWVTTAYT